MAIAMIDASMIKKFVENQSAFDIEADKLFSKLDMDHDGVLSRVELLKGLEGLLSSAEPLTPTSPTTTVIENAVFEKFDDDNNGNVDKNEFQREMRQIMMAMASGIGDSPVQMLIDDDSFLMCVIEHERSKGGS